MLRDELYSQKESIKLVRQSDGYVYGYRENKMQHICAGSQVYPALLSVMDAKDAKTLDETGEVTLAKQEAPKA
jgi:hypothetical protein